MENTDRFEAQARELVEKMTLEERAAMLRYDAPAVPRLGVPEYNWWNEALHGVARAGTATVFPQAIALAATFDRKMLERVGDVAATEGRAKYNEAVKHGDRGIYKGLTFWSPNINIFRDPRWGRGHETYGEDPYLTGEMGAAFVSGIQKKDEKGYMKAAACAKHFAVHSGPEADRHSFDANVSKKDLWETYLPAFEKLVVEAKVEGVMGAYNRLYGEPCCGSRLLLKEILRKKWGFDGYTVSDCGAIMDFHQFHRVTDDVVESAAMAVRNGCDLNCGGSYPYVMAAWERGLVTDEEITEHAVNVMRTRMRLGLFDPECSFNEVSYDVVCCDEHIEASLQAARESIVLLKNDGVLPLENVQTLGVIGPNADNRVALLGNYHGTPDRCVTLLDGIIGLAKDKGVRVMYSQGCALSKDRLEARSGEPDDRISEALTVAERSDVVVLCLGLDETLEGEEGDAGGERDSLELPACQRRLMEAVCSVGKPVVLVLMTGGATDLRYADEHCAAIVQAWYPGARGGQAMAEVLFGEVSPSGKLPVTFYRSTEDLPEYGNYSMESRTYRYFDGEALYPVGFGLSYADIRIVVAAMQGDNAVDVKVRNNSDFEASEVVQVYVQPKDGRFAPKNPVLCGFERVTLGAGEEKWVTVALSKNAYTVVDDEGQRVLWEGEYSVFCGFSQPDCRSEALTGKACMVNVQKIGKK